MTKVLLKELLKALGLGVIIFIVFFIIRIASGVSVSWDYLLFTNFLHKVLIEKILKKPKSAENTLPIIGS